MRRPFFVVMIALLVAVGCKKDSKKDTGGDANPPVNPAPGPLGDLRGKTGGSDVPGGWAEARDPIGGYRLLMPGITKFHESFAGSTALQKMQATSCSHGVKGLDTDVRVRSVSFVPPVSFKMGTTPDELFAALKLARTNFETFHTVLEKTAVKLGGREAVKIVTKPVDLTAGAKLPDDPRAGEERLQERKKLEAKRTTYYVTTAGARIVFLEIDSPTEPPPGLIKTVTESFAFQ
jgi:hypothetical protein